MHRLTHTSGEEEKRIESVLGGYNDPPPGLRFVSQDEVLNRLQTYSPDYIIDRQVLGFGPGRQGFLGLTLFYYSYDRTGVGFGMDQVGGRVWVAFGCKHVLRELSQTECRKRGIEHCGRFWHVYECQRCGHIESVDTSG